MKTAENSPASGSWHHSPSNLRERIGAILATQVLGLTELAGRLGVPARELREFMQGGDYLFNRELEGIWLKLPRYEAEAGLKPMLDERDVT